MKTPKVSVLCTSDYMDKYGISIPTPPLATSVMNLVRDRGIKNNDEFNIAYGVTCDH
jgi:hypothetical protein